jgi:hypothetical protein
MTLRLPRVWPSCTALTVVLTLHTAVVCAILLLSSSRQDADATFAGTGPIVLLLAAAAFGMRRIRTFHPALQPEYRFWLWMTPWTPAKALPLGPVHLVGADVALLATGVAAALPFYGVANSLLIVKVFLTAYTISLLATLFLTGERFTAYAVWFGLGTMVLFWSHDGPFFASAAATYGMSMYSFRRSLPRFPWSFTVPSMKELLQRPPLPGVQNRMLFGWPFAYLAPGDYYLSLSLVHGAIVSLLVGWSAYVSLTLMPAEVQDAGCVLFPQTILLATLARVLIYRVNEHRPPISLAGRVQTGRWIIPAYDRVFVAPLLALALSPLAGILRLAWGVPSGLALPVTATLTFLILMTVGPARRTWLLTAPSRIVPFAGNRYGHWV